MLNVFGGIEMVIGICGTGALLPGILSAFMHKQVQNAAPELIMIGFFIMAVIVGNMTMTYKRLANWLNVVLSPVIYFGTVYILKSIPDAKFKILPKTLRRDIVALIAGDGLSILAGILTVASLVFFLLPPVRKYFEETESDEVVNLVGGALISGWMMYSGIMGMANPYFISTGVSYVVYFGVFLIGMGLLLRVDIARVLAVIYFVITIILKIKDIALTVAGFFIRNSASNKSIELVVFDMIYAVLLFLPIYYLTLPRVEKQYKIIKYK